VKDTTVEQDLPYSSDRDSDVDPIHYAVNPDDQSSASDTSSEHSYSLSNHYDASDLDNMSAADEAESEISYDMADIHSHPGSVDSLIGLEGWEEVPGSEAH
jgi:hypothetical protein